MRDASYYTGLIPSWNAGRPNFYRIVLNVTTPAVNAMTGLYAAKDAFSLTVAEGAQLDQVGEWIGRTRNIVVPLENVYFSWETSGLGWNEGYWKGPNDPSTGVVSLDDTTYRLLLEAKARANLWDGTLPTMAPIYEQLTGGTVVVVDNQDMSMTVYVASVLLPPLVQQLLVGGYVTLKPMGVDIGYVVVTGDAPLFGFDLDNAFVAGFDEGYWGAVY